MKNKEKSKIIYCILFFVVFMYAARYLLNTIEKFDNNITEMQYNIEGLQTKVEDLKKEYEVALIDNQSKINDLENQIAYEKNKFQLYKIKDEIPYEFVQYSEFRDNIIDIKQIKLYNNRTVNIAVVELQGVNNVISFLSHISNQYRPYYLLSLTR